MRMTLFILFPGEFYIIRHPDPSEGTEEDPQIIRSPSFPFILTNGVNGSDGILSPLEDFFDLEGLHCERVKEEELSILAQHYELEGEPLGALMVAPKQEESCKEGNLQEIFAGIASGKITATMPPPEATEPVVTDPIESFLD